MTKYTRDYQVGMDIQWHLLGADGSIAEFSSGGGILPTLIAADSATNERLTTFFNQLQYSTEVLINPHLDKYIDLSTIGDMKQFVRVAASGLWSFDKTFYCAGDADITQHLIAAPVHPLPLSSLPVEIQELLQTRRQSIRFSDFRKLDAGYLPWANLFADYDVRPVYEHKSKRRWFASRFDSLV